MSSALPPNTILRRYCHSPDDVQVSPLGQGNINDTFLVEDHGRTLVLQRINGQVFPKPQRLIHNLELLSLHLADQEKNCDRRWQDPILLAADDGSPAVEDDHGSLWRALSHIGNSKGYEQAQNLLLAKETGWALGYFHGRLKGMSSLDMKVPLPGFHSLSGYLKRFRKTFAARPRQHSPEIQFCMDRINSRQEQALTLEQALQAGTIKQSITHGDPKIANVLFDLDSGLAVSLIDLDTVGPGLIEHDLGDCLRSVCNNQGEDAERGQVSFNLDYCEATLKGYFQASAQLSGRTPGEYIFDGLQAICFELGLRFFTDFLQGGIYFKCKNPEEILRKAEVQFALLEDILEKERAIRRIVYSNEHAPSR